MRSYSRVPAALLDVNLNAIAIANATTGVLAPSGHFAEDFDRLPETLSDALMLAPRLTFKVTGVNLPLAVLTMVFGASAVDELLREGDIEFILWREYVAMLGTPLEGAVPFIHGTFTSPEHSDPECSNVKGLAAVLSLSDSQRRRLAQLATERTTTTSPHGAEQAWRALLDAHRNGELAVYGVPAEVPLSTINMAQKSRIVYELVNLHHAAEMVERELDLRDAPETWNAMLLLAREVNSSPRVVSTGEAVLRQESVPSVGELVSRGTLTPSEVLTMRRSSAARAFRQWLWSRTDPADTKAVLEEYRQLIARDRKDLDGKWWYRAMRVVGLEIAGATIEQAIPAAGIAVKTAVQSSISLLDELLKLLKERRSPRRLSRMLHDVADEEASS
jgi:hypothetical protein